jgi:hypothetical protein
MIGTVAILTDLHGKTVEGSVTDENESGVTRLLSSNKQIPTALATQQAGDASG